MALRLVLCFSVLCLSCASESRSIPAFEELLTLDASGEADCEGQYVAAVTGRMVDASGAPVESGRPQLCVHRADGLFVCLAPPETRPDGWWVQVLDEANRCMDSVALRAGKPGSGFGTTYCPLELELDNSVYNHPVDVVLHSLSATLPPIGDESLAREVTLGDGLVLTDVVPADFFGSYEALGAHRVPGPHCFAEGMELEAVYVLGPEAFPADDGWGVRIPNSSGLADGTRVELLVLGGLATTLDGELVPEAELAPFGQGTVVGDTIVGDDDARLTDLTWLAVRAL